MPLDQRGPPSYDERRFGGRNFRKRLHAAAVLVGLAAVIACVVCAASLYRGPHQDDHVRNSPSQPDDEVRKVLLKSISGRRPINLPIREKLPEPTPEPVERPIVFAALTPTSALKAARHHTFRVELDSAEDTHDGWIIYDCKGDDADVLFTVWLPEGSEVEDEMVVTGTLKVIRHAPSPINPDGFTEYRLICQSR